MTRPDGPDGDGDDAIRAAALGRLVDELLDGKTPRPALAAEDRALLETAALVRSAYRPSGAAAEVTPPATTAGVEVAGPTPRRRFGRLAPWALAGLAAAAAITLALRPAPAPAPAPYADRLPSALRSRSLDALVGRIEPGSDPTRRADLVYADRLAGYRQLGLRPGSYRR